MQENTIAFIICRVHWEMSEHFQDGTKWLTFCKRHFQMDFLGWKMLYFDLNFTGSLRVPLTLISMGSCNSLSQNRKETIAWIKDSPLRWFYVSLGLTVLTYWGRVMHICVENLAIIGSDNGLPPGWRQAIIWANDRILLIGCLGTNFSEILIAVYTFSFRKMRLKISLGKWQPFCLSLNELTAICRGQHP